MKEEKCDCCGKVISGYYPEKEVEKIKEFSGIFMHSFGIPGVKKDLTLSINYVGDIPSQIKFIFCSLECLSEFLRKKDLFSDF